MGLYFYTQVIFHQVTGFEQLFLLNANIYKFLEMLNLIIEINYTANA